MSEKKVPLWYVKARIKVKNGLAWCKEKANEGLELAKEHPEVAVAAAGLVATGIRSTSRMIISEREKAKYDRSFYDKRTGRREWAKRKPTRTQLTIINERHLAGESYREILDDMNLLK